MSKRAAAAAENIAKAVDDTASSPIDPTRCPLCGQDNGCANSLGQGRADYIAKSQPCSGDSATDCWCYNRNMRFPVELIEQLTKAQQRQACICRRCAEAFLQSHTRQ